MREAKFMRNLSDKVIKAKHASKSDKAKERFNKNKANKTLKEEFHIFNQIKIQGKHAKAN